MESLSIVANQSGYGIFDHDEEQTLVSGISSYKNALTIFERLTTLKESVAYLQRDLGRNVG